MFKIDTIKNKKIIIYGFGITGKWLSSNLKSEFIVDTDSKKWGNVFNGNMVVSPSRLREFDPGEILVVVTVVDIFDVIPLLNYYNVLWIPLSGILEDHKYSIGINITSESDTFLKYSIDTVLKCQSAAMSDDVSYLRSVDLVITEKCTLKCKDCANLMQYYETPINYEVDEIVSGITQLAESVSFVHEVRVIGGEPFLNKDIYEIVNTLSSIDNIHKIIIYTNGMIPPDFDKLATFERSKILFSITDYADLGRNLDKTIKVLEHYSLPYRVHPPEHWTDSGRILKSNEDLDNAKILFAKCCGKNLFTLISDKLYRCPFAANASRLKAIPEHNSNFVRVDETQKAIKDFAYGIDHIDACLYCPGRSFDSPLITPAVQVKRPLPYSKYIKIDLI